MSIEGVLKDFTAITGAGAVSITRSGIVEVEAGGGVPRAVVAEAVKKTDEAAFRLPYGEQFFLVLRHGGSKHMVIIGAFDKLTERVMSEASFVWDILSVDAAEIVAGANRISAARSLEDKKEHNPYDQERREQESIRKGNIEQLHECWSEKYVGEIGTLADDRLRDVKNLVVGVITLSSRSAIEGGMDAEEAFTATDEFIRQCERMTEPENVIEHLHSAQMFFASRINHIKSEGMSYNPIVQRAKKYILNNIHGHIIVDDIAQELGVKANYLSHIFSCAEKKTITQYTHDKKLELCENMLKYTDMSLQEISESVGFCTQSYFTQLFKRKNGVTPKRYRLIYGTVE